MGKPGRFLPAGEDGELQRCNDLLLLLLLLLSFFLPFFLSLFVWIEVKYLLAKSDGRVGTYTVYFSGSEDRRYPECW